MFKEIKFTMVNEPERPGTSLAKRIFISL